MSVLCVLWAFLAFIQAQDCTPANTQIPMGCTQILSATGYTGTTTSCATQPYPADATTRSNAALTCAAIGVARLGGSTQTLPSQCYCASDIAIKLAGLTRVPTCANSDVRITSFVSTDHSCVQGTVILTNLYAVFATSTPRQDVGYIIAVDGGLANAAGRACSRGMFAVRSPAHSLPASIYTSTSPTVNITCPALINVQKDNDACGDIVGSGKVPIGYIALACSGSLGSYLSLSTIVNWNTACQSDCWDSVDPIRGGKCILGPVPTNILIVSNPLVATTVAATPTPITSGNTETVTVAFSNTRTAVPNGNAFNPAETITSWTDTWFANSATAQPSATCSSSAIAATTVIPTSTMSCTTYSGSVPIHAGTPPAGATFVVNNPAGLIGRVIPAATTLQCTYTALVCGNGGATSTLRLTVGVTDAYGRTNSSSSSQTVGITDHQVQVELQSQNSQGQNQQGQNQQGQNQNQQGQNQQGNGRPSATATMTLTLSPTSSTVVSGANVVVAASITTTNFVPTTVAWSSNCASVSGCTAVSNPSTCSGNSCSFTFTFAGAFGAAPAVTITAAATDSGGHSLSQTSTFTPTIGVSLAGDRALTEPGSGIIFTIGASNTGSSTITNFNVDTSSGCPPQAVLSSTLFNCPSVPANTPVGCTRTSAVSCTVGGTSVALPATLTAGQSISCQFNAIVCGDAVDSPGTASAAVTVGSSTFTPTYTLVMQNHLPGVSTPISLTGISGQLEIDVDPTKQVSTDPLRLTLTVNNCPVVATCPNPATSCTTTGTWSCVLASDNVTPFNIATDLFLRSTNGIVCTATICDGSSPTINVHGVDNEGSTFDATAS